MNNLHFSCSISQGRDDLFSNGYCSNELKESIQYLVDILLKNPVLLPLYQEASRMHRTSEDFSNNFDTFFEIQRDTYFLPDEVKEDFRDAFLRFVQSCSDYSNDKGKLVEHLADEVMKKFYQDKQVSPNFTYEGCVVVEFGSEVASSSPKTIDVCSKDNSFGDFVECKCLISPDFSKDEAKVTKISSVHELLQEAHKNNPHDYRIMILVSHANESKLNYLRRAWSSAPIVSLEEFISIFQLI